MGITIHYKGKAKDLESIDGVIKELGEMAEVSGREYGIVDEEVKGDLCPSWGYGFGYIPSQEAMEKQNIEFFPAMVSKDCNGYFTFFDSKYREEMRHAFQKGKRAEFSVDTRQKGIWLNVHPKCETLEFMFDVKTLELANYARYDHTPELIYGYEGLFCKTQFAGVKVHILVCKIIQLTEKYIDYSEIYDEAGFYDTQDVRVAQKAFTESRTMLAEIAMQLEKAFEGKGVEMAIGEKL